MNSGVGGGRKDIFQVYRDRRNGSVDDKVRSITVEALSELIVEKRENGSAGMLLTPTPTEYFAAIMTAIENGQSGPQQIPLMFLFSVVVKSLPLGVLRLKGMHVIALTLRKLENQSQEELQDTRVSRYGLAALGSVVAAQESSKVSWNQPKMTQALFFIMNRVADDSPKIRRVAQEACAEILERHRLCTSPFSQLIELSRVSIEKAAVGDTIFAQRLVSFLEHIAPSLGRRALAKDLRSICAQLVGLVRLAHAGLSTSAFLTVHKICVAIPEEHDEPNMKRNENQIEARLRLLNDVCKSLCEISLADTQQLRFVGSDPKLSRAWCAAVQSAESGLYKYSVSHGNRVLSQLPRVANACLNFVSAGLRRAAESGVNALGQAPVALPIGTLTQLVRLETELTSLPDTLSKLVEALDSVLSPQFEESWPLLLEALRAYFEVFGLVAGPRNAAVKECEDIWIEKMASIREGVINPVTGADKPKVIVRWKTSIARVTGTAVAVLGVERVLNVLPLGVDGAKEVSAIRTWLLPIIRNSIGSGPADTSLEFFRTRILARAEQCELKAQNPLMGPNNAKILRTRTVQLWSLLPGFCLKPKDIQPNSGFASLAPVLGQALEDEERYPELTEYICLGLQNIISFVSSRKEQFPADFGAVADMAQNFLPLLFNLYEVLVQKEQSGRSDFVHNLISSYSQIAPQDLVNTLFRQLVQNILTSIMQKDPKAETERRPKSRKSDMEEEEAEEEESDEEGMDVEERRAGQILLSLSLALVPALNTESTDMLFRVVRPYVKDLNDPILQKRAYRIVEAICEHQPEWIISKHDELVTLMQDAFDSSSASSKTARLKCLYHIYNALSRQESDVTADAAMEMVSDMVGEVVLSLKEPNNKARSCGYKLLVEMGNFLELVAARGAPLDKKHRGATQFLHMLLGGLAAQTSFMKSASIGALCRMFGEWGKREELRDDLVHVADTTLLLLREQTREVADSAITFAKICAIRLPVPVLKLVLKTLLTEILPWASAPKSRFSLRIRVIFERLTKRIGEEELVGTGMIPRDHKVLTYIRKQAAYKKRRYERKIDNNGDRKMGLGDDDEMDSSDDDDGNEKQKKRAPAAALTGGRKRRRDTDGDELMMQEGEDAIDLLGANALGRVKRLRPGQSHDPENLEDEFKMAKDGRIIVPGEENTDQDDDGDGLGKGKKRSNYESDDQDSDDEDKNRRPAMKPLKDRPIGSEFKSKKSGGDVKKKSSKFEPYAYVRLDPRLLNKRKKAQAQKQFKGLAGKRHRQKGQRNSRA